MSDQVEEYPLVKIPIENLQFDESNPNKPTKEQIAAIKKSFHRFGYLVPIIVNESYEIGDGEHRALIYKELGIKEIPAYVVPKINDDIERRLLRQTMNKLRGEHEPKLDAQEIALIFKNDKLDNLAELLAQDRQTLEKILTKEMGIQFEREDNFNVVKALEEIVPDTQLGDMWQLDQHRVICADNSDKASLHRLIQDNSIELVFADPPYNLDFDYNEHDDDLSNKDYFFLCKNAYDNVKNVTSKVVITPGPRNITIWYDIAGAPKDIGIWYKRNSSTYGSLFMRRLCEPILFFGEYDAKNKRPTDFFDYTRTVDNEAKAIEKEVGLEKFAPWKPIKLITDIIKQWSSPGDIVLDPFLGSGTTLIAAEQTKRICYGIELDPHYVDVVVKRWEAMTGKTAKKIVPLKV